jgi:hypothetical protein
MKKLFALGVVSVALGLFVLGCKKEQESPVSSTPAVHSDATSTTAPVAPTLESPSTTPSEVPATETPSTPDPAGTPAN